jgi:hypothetical protein
MPRPPYVIFPDASLEQMATDYPVTLEELKKQMNVEFDDDNGYIEELGKVAIAHVFHSTRRSREELAAMADGEAFPRPLRLAALQLAAHWYRLREPVASASQNVVPYTYECLVKPFIKLG